MSKIKTHTKNTTLKITDLLGCRWTDDRSTAVFSKLSDIAIEIRGEAIENRVMK